MTRMGQLWFAKQEQIYLPGMSLFAFATAASGLICPPGQPVLGWLARGGCSQWCAWRSQKVSSRNTRSWTRDAQSAVDAAIANFAKQAHAVPLLERPQHSRDDRIRTIRIDSRWRGIVLAPGDGDTYCLITVLPHEKANAYAAGHRFSVNGALGVLEVRDEEAIQQLQPSLQVAAEPNETRLFADVSDADLVRLGVDPQILPTVRLLTSEIDLETLQTMLPDAQYAALHALACGMTVDEAWDEVARLLSADMPPEQVDPGDLVSAMERTPGQVTFVSGQEELQLILAHPFAAWRTFLHPSQRKIAYRESYSGPAQVTGGPGTGKTVTVLHRAAFLAARAAASTPTEELEAAGQVSLQDRIPSRCC